MRGKNYNIIFGAKKPAYLVHRVEITELTPLVSIYLNPQSDSVDK